jgi:hypothetical protein
MLVFHGELLALHATPELEDCPLADVRDCVFNIDLINVTLYI